MIRCTVFKGASRNGRACGNPGVGARGRPTGRPLLRLALLFLGVCGAGCSDWQASDPFGSGGAGWSQSRLPNTPRDLAFQAGVETMRQWFRVAESSPADGTIRSEAVEYVQQGGTGRIRDATIGYPNRMRRTATLVIRDRGAGSLAKCQVNVQRLDTADHRVFRSNERFEDVPNETPIDRDAGISARQNQVWSDMPRDRALEREMLAALRTRVGGEEQ